MPSPASGMDESLSQSAPEQHLKAGRQDLGEEIGLWQICSITVIADRKMMGLIQSYGIISSFFPLASESFGSIF